MTCSPSEPRSGACRHPGSTKGGYPLCNAIALTLSLIAILPSAANASSAKYTLKGTLDPSTGDYPVPGLTQGADGALYDLAIYGGAYNHGGIFRVGTDGAAVLLNSFDGVEINGVTSPLTALPDGGLWSTSVLGGAAGQGTVFKVDPITGDVTVAHSFAVNDPDGLDGRSPHTPLLRGADGKLYGTTLYGGAKTRDGYAAGTIFRIDPRTFEFTRLHSFSIDPKDPQGGFPSGLTTGPDGRQYGASTVYRGDAPQYSVIFAFDPNTREVTTVHVMDANVFADSELISGPGAELFGISNSSNADSYGEVFAVSATGEYRVVHKFDGQHGAEPVGHLTLGTDGWLYGNTLARTGEGAGTSHGVAYRVLPSGAAYTVLKVYAPALGRGPFLQVDQALWSTTNTTIYTISRPAP